MHLWSFVAEENKSMSTWALYGKDRWTRETLRDLLSIFKAQRYHFYFEELDKKMLLWSEDVLHYIFQRQKCNSFSRRADNVSILDGVISSAWEIFSVLPRKGSVERRFTNNNLLDERLTNTIIQQKESLFSKRLPVLGYPRDSMYYL